ncbi:hypothetical protein SSX86_008456 [Deinandra increscens subsp. villosa]|uniref:F-box domain-containing protein n=1 Tax=Deinandra increscens subsp. villosa TaxID=3103831 RepID=A0AAP0DJ34_9ASTR
MDKLPHDVLLQILSRLDDSADVARCRVASKAFNTVFPGLRSINLRSSIEWHSWASTSPRIKPFKTVFLHLISKLEAVESVCLVFDRWIHRESDDFSPTDGDFAEWLPRVSGSLKSISITNRNYERQLNVLVLISAFCHNLDNLKLRFGWVSVDNLNLMPMLTSLTLEYVRMEDKCLNELNKCFPNLQVLKFLGVSGIEDPKIHLLNLKTCVWHDPWTMRSMTIITPNLITLTIQCCNPRLIHIEAHMLSYFQFNAFSYADEFMLKKFKNLKTLWLDPDDICPLLSKLPIIKTIENLTLDSIKKPQRERRDPAFTLGKLFTVFPNASSLCIRSGPWSDLEACLNPEEVWEILDGSKGLKTICAYLMLGDPSLTFSNVARVLEQCDDLSKVSLLIHSDVTCHVYESFRSKCMVRWPWLKWRWGIWSKNREDSWITDGSSIEHHKSTKKQRVR